MYDIGSARLVNGIGSYTHAMHAFAECAEVIPEPCGYCHDALDSARYLANHDVCAGCEGPATFGQPGDTESGYGTDAFTGGGSTTDIGCEHRHVLSGPVTPSITTSFRCEQSTSGSRSAQRCKECTRSVIIRTWASAASWA